MRVSFSANFACFACVVRNVRLLWGSHAGILSYAPHLQPEISPRLINGVNQKWDAHACNSPVSVFLIHIDTLHINRYSDRPLNIHTRTRTTNTSIIIAINQLHIIIQTNNHCSFDDNCQRLGAIITDHHTHTHTDA